MSEKKAIGIDIGGTNLRVALVSAAGEVLNKVKVSSTGDIMAAIGRAVTGMLDDSVVGVGVGVAGLIDREGRRVLTSPNLQNIEGLALGEIVPGRRVVIENDANAAAIGERWMGAGREFRNFVLLTLGIGLHRGRKYGMRDVFGFRTLRDLPFTKLAKKVKAAYEGRDVPDHRGWPAQREALTCLVDKGVDGIYQLNTSDIRVERGDGR